MARPRKFKPALRILRPICRLICLAAIFASQSSRAEGTTEQIQGVFDPVFGNTATQSIGFRTAASDLVLDLSLLPRQVQDQARATLPSSSIVSLFLESKAVLSRRDVPFGIRPDCTELPLGIDEVKTLANSRGVKTQQDFLDAIPPGTLQGFTLVYDSQSVQRGKKCEAKDQGLPECQPKITPEFPRVLRTSKNGELTLTYVCDPSNPSYGTIEVLRFEAQTRAFKTTEIDLKKSPGFGEKFRVNENPAICASCHSSLNAGGIPSLKPIWPEYFFWSDCRRKRGISIYGSSDDNMGPLPGEYRPRKASSYLKVPDGCSDEDDLTAHLEETANFEKFKLEQVDNPDPSKINPCYASLPWPRIPQGKGDEEPYLNYKYYPYSAKSQAIGDDDRQDYAIRTNLRFTDIYSRLDAKRLASLIETSADYLKARLYLAMEGAGCLLQSDIQELLAELPSLKIDPAANSHFRSPGPNRFPLLYSYGEHIGFKDEEWQMDFKLSGESSYTAGVPNVSRFNDLTIPDIVFGNLLADLAATEASVRAIAPDPMKRGTTTPGHFRENFACLDDEGSGLKDEFKWDSAGGPFAPGPSSEGTVCGTLHDLAARQAKVLSVAPPASLPTSVLSPVRPNYAHVASLDPNSIQRGKALVNGGRANCVKCHSPTKDNEAIYPRDFLFLPAPGLSAPRNYQATIMLQMRYRDGYLSTLDKRVLIDKDMPPHPEAGDNSENERVLTDTDRQDVASYIECLMRAPRPQDL